MKGKKVEDKGIRMAVNMARDCTIMELAEKAYEGITKGLREDTLLCQVLPSSKLEQWQQKENEDITDKVCQVIIKEVLRPAVAVFVIGKAKKQL